MHPSSSWNLLFATCLAAFISFRTTQARIDFSGVTDQEYDIAKLSGRPEGVDELSVVIEGATLNKLPIPCFAGLLAFDEYVNKCLTDGLHTCDDGVKNWLEWAAVGAESAADKNNPTTTTSLEGKDIKEVVIKPYPMPLLAIGAQIRLVDKHEAMRKVAWKGGGEGWQNNGTQFDVNVTMDLDGDDNPKLTVVFVGYEAIHVKRVVFSADRQLVMWRIASWMSSNLMPRTLLTPNLLHLWSYNNDSISALLGVVRYGNDDPRDTPLAKPYVYMAVVSDHSVPPPTRRTVLTRGFAGEAFGEIVRDLNTKANGGTKEEDMEFKAEWMMCWPAVRNIINRRQNFYTEFDAFLKGLGVDDLVPHELNRYLDFSTDQLEEKVEHLRLILDDSRSLHMFAVANNGLKTNAAHLAGCDILQKDSLKVRVLDYMFHKDPQDLVENEKRVVVDLLLSQHNRRVLEYRQNNRFMSSLINWIPEWLINYWIPGWPKVHHLELKDLEIDEMVEKICSENMRKHWEADGNK
eukprot:GHVS01066073.1.p1 GENE.GHVS01066073.1~~GHVS01066073.1.p1  ORF type:complete len:519 (+),score=52.85 GHVS01066073.1:421-1977(+)